MKTRIPQSRPPTACGLALCVFLALIVISCSAPPTQPIDRVTIPNTNIDQPLPHASVAKIQGDPDRMEADVIRAIERNHWAEIRHEMIPSKLATTQPAAAPPPKKTGGKPVADLTQPAIHADVLLPDGRGGVVYAWPIDEKPFTIAVAVRVGPFGDAKEEQGYVDMLARTLADKPKPKRGGTFVIPD